MHTNDRLHARVWTLVVFVLLIGMGCSLFSRVTENSSIENEQFTPAPMPTAGGTLMWLVSSQDATYMLSIMPSNGMTIVNAGQIK